MSECFSIDSPDQAVITETPTHHRCRLLKRSEAQPRVTS